MATAAKPAPCKGTGAWYYNDMSGVMNRVPSLLEGPYLTAFGWHKLNISYCATRDQAIAEAKKEFPNGANPGGSIGGNIGKAVGGAVGNAVLSPLFQGNIWIRVAEVVLGLVLVAVGLAKMTNAVPVATKIAKVVA